MKLYTRNKERDTHVFVGHLVTAVGRIACGRNPANYVLVETDLNSIEPPHWGYGRITSQKTTVQAMAISPPPLMHERIRVCRDCIHSPNRYG